MKFYTLLNLVQGERFTADYVVVNIPVSLLLITNVTPPLLNSHNLALSLFLLSLPTTPSSRSCHSRSSGSHQHTQSPPPTCVAPSSPAHTRSGAGPPFPAHSSP